MRNAGSFAAFSKVKVLPMIVRLLSNITKEPDMFTLFVNGVAAIKLAKKSEIPARRGKEPWMVVDANGNTIASYSPA